MKHTLKLLCLLLALLLPMQLCGCAAKNNTDLTAGIIPNEIPKTPVSAEASAAAADFAVRLFRAGCETDKNMLISPLSVLCALSMTANGAESGTLTQMESTLGLRRDLYNAFFQSWLTALYEDPSGVLKLANSVWFRDEAGFSVKKEFLQVNADWYGADVFKAPFDESTLSEINDWVSERTDGMIPEILDQIPKDAAMYLINALAFEAKWQSPYDKADVWQEPFTRADATKKTADFMHSTENTYLEDENATGFLKYYKGGRYAFAALLPNEGVSVETYLDTLTGEGLQRLISGASYEDVITALPKFESEYKTELSGTLKTMGMELPFDARNADFTGISEGPEPMCISRVLHRTYICVDEGGTRAAAATAVEATTAAAAEPQKPKEVRLDRPFVYMIVDCQTNVPLFIGTVQDPTER